MSKHRTERMCGVEASERLRRAMIWAPGARVGWLFAPGASGAFFSIVWACSRQLPSTDGARGGGRPPRVVRSAVLAPAPGNGYAPAAKPVTPLSAACQRSRHHVEPAPCNGYAPAAKPATPLSAGGQRLERHPFSGHQKWACIARNAG